MHILLVCNKFPFPPRDGGSLATYNMIRGLVEAGNRVDLLAMNTSKHYSSEGAVKNDISGLNGVREVYVDNSVTVPGLLNNFLFSSIPYNAQKFISKEFETVLTVMIRNNNYDIVQLEGLYLAPYVRAIRENCEARIAYRAHNIEYIIWDSYCKNAENVYRKLYLGNLKKRIRNFELQFINKYDLLVAITEDDLKTLNGLGNEKPSIVSPFGMYPEEFPVTERSGTEGLCLQYIGALDWIPNIESLNWFVDRVWMTIKKKYPQLRFNVAGRNANNRLKKKMARNGIDFFGEVESSKDFLSREGIFITPLFSGSGIRVKIIEAMFMKKTIIATPFAVSGIPVENGRNILLAGSDNEFIESIDILLNDKNLAARIGNRGGEMAKRYFNNRLITEELSAFYKNFSV